MAMTPSDQDVHRPNSRPICARCPLEERAPEPLDRSWIEANGRDCLGVSQGLVHRAFKTAPDPAIKWQHKPALRPLEQRGVKAAQTDAPQHGLLAEWLIARLLRQAIHTFKEDLIHQRHTLLQRGSH